MIIKVVTLTGDERMIDVEPSDKILGVYFQLLGAIYYITTKVNNYQRRITHANMLFQHLKRN